MTCLGKLYQTSFSDLPRAFEWYKKGVTCGDANSMVRLGKMLEDGSAGTTDKIQAYAYYFFASRFVPEARDAGASLWAEFSKKEQELASKKIKELHTKGFGVQCNWGDLSSRQPLTSLPGEAK